MEKPLSECRFTGSRKTIRLSVPMLLQELLRLQGSQPKQCLVRHRRRGLAGTESNLRELASNGNCWKAPKPQSNDCKKTW